MVGIESYEAIPPGALGRARVTMRAGTAQEAGDAPSAVDGPSLSERLSKTQLALAEQLG